MFLDMRLPQAKWPRANLNPRTGSLAAVVLAAAAAVLVLLYAHTRRTSPLFCAIQYKNRPSHSGAPKAAATTVEALGDMVPLTAVAFDFDETIGNFHQFSQLTTTLEAIYNDTMTVEDYAYILKQSMFPHYIRPGMLQLLKSLGKRKRSGDRCKGLIYTNNQGGRKWVRDIARAIELLIDEPKLFDRIIYAYSFRGLEEAGERCRTSHDKKHSDFLACTRYAKNTHVIFVDDLMHEHMVHPNVSYVHIAEYRWNYERNHIVDTCVRGGLVQANSPDADYLRRQINHANQTSHAKLQYHYDLTHIMSKFIDAHFDSLNGMTTRSQSRDAKAHGGQSSSSSSPSSPIRLV